MTQHSVAMFDVYSQFHWEVGLDDRLESGARLPSFPPGTFSGKGSAFAWLKGNVIFGCREGVEEKEGGRRKFGGNECWELLPCWTHIPFFFEHNSAHVLKRKGWRSEGGRYKQLEKYRGKRLHTTAEAKGKNFISLRLGFDNTGILCWPAALTDVAADEGRLGHTLMWPHTQVKFCHLFIALLLTSCVFAVSLRPLSTSH